MGLGVLVEHMWGSFDLVVFNVLLGSFGALGIFPDRRFLKRYCYYSYDSSTKLFTCVPCDSPPNCFFFSLKFEFQFQGFLNMKFDTVAGKMKTCKYLGNEMKQSKMG